VTKPNLTAYLLQKGRAFWPSLFLCVLACSSADAPSASNEANTYQQQRLATYQSTVYPAAVQCIQTGDLVFRLGTDITSEIFRQMNTKIKQYSHCGIASIENDSIFVYHAIGGEFNPNQIVKRETLYSFGHVADNKALAVYQISNNKLQQISNAKLAAQFYDGQIPFDMQFDYGTDNRLYCTEMVAKCMSRSLLDSSWLRFDTIGYKAYVTLDALLLAPVSKAKGSWVY
jgi:hypothetical protein